MTTMLLYHRLHPPNSHMVPVDIASSRVGFDYISAQSITIAITSVLHDCDDDFDYRQSSIKVINYNYD